MDLWISPHYVLCSVKWRVDLNGLWMSSLTASPLHSLPHYSAYLLKGLFLVLETIFLEASAQEGLSESLIRPLILHLSAVFPRVSAANGYWERHWWAPNESGSLRKVAFQTSVSARPGCGTLPTGIPTFSPSRLLFLVFLPSCRQKLHSDSRNICLLRAHVKIYVHTLIDARQVLLKLVQYNQIYIITSCVFLKQNKAEIHN